ncbi:MAG TPA: carbohydrate kinase family protein [Chloroflexia bacterium]|nr:carbohydrate kinase family protein [Chloroflexia bacterium]
MSRLLVQGNVNLETTLRIPTFPIPYQSAQFVPHAVDIGVSGVGYNLAKALSVLGDEVVLAAILGRDTAAATIRKQLHDDGLRDRYVLGQADKTALSVVAYDASGKRAAFADLKDLMTQVYPHDLFSQALAGVEAVLFTQAAYCRPLLATARDAGKLLAVDLQLIADLDDPYKRPYLESAEVVFMSGEALPEPPETWAWHLLERYPGVRVVGIGLGAEGALLAVRDTGLTLPVPSVATRPVVNTSGAGDALFACFMHYYLSTRDAEASLRRAVVFASFKIGEAGSSQGLLDEADLEQLYRSLHA